MNILGRNVTLRAIEASDLPLLHQWANDPEIQSKLVGWHFPTSMRDQERWLESLSCTSLHQRFANLVDIDWKSRCAFHGMMLGDLDIRGKGYGRDSIMAIMRYAFQDLGLNRLDGAMLENNDASIHVYTKKCGWVIEGRSRARLYRNGRFLDRVDVGVIRSDYEKLIATTDYWN